jgi:hypothetical protein
VAGAKAGGRKIILSHRIRDLVANQSALLALAHLLANKAWVVPMMPILLSSRSADIRHNIAQERQEERVVGEQNNTFVPA